MNTLILGGDGQLGQTFEFLKGEFNFMTLYFTNKSQINILDRNSILNFVNDNKIKLIINCAAYTNVDKAEIDNENCYNVNAFAVKNIISVCKQNDIFLIHFSTDYVFDGLKSKPYNEKNSVNPLNIYRKSKLLGEKFIMNSKIKAVVIRTSWLFSVFGNNFLNKIVDLSKTEKEIAVVDDQTGSPTSSVDLVKFCLKLIRELLDNKIILPAIFHYSNAESTTWFNFAKKIKKHLKLNLEVLPSKSDFSKAKAIRPKYSVLDSSLAENYFNNPIISWDKALCRDLNEFFYE